jgi:hypothetical protein
VVRLTNFRAAVQLYNFRLAGKKKIVRATGAGCARRPPSLIRLATDQDACGHSLAVPCFTVRGVARDPHSHGVQPSGEQQLARQRVRALRRCRAQGYWQLGPDALFQLTVAKEIKGAATCVSLTRPARRCAAASRAAAARPMHSFSG